MVTGIVRSSTLMREPVVDRANCQLNGHLALDRAIAAIGGLLRSHLRCSDHAARWGGEEFVVALTSTGVGGSPSPRSVIEALELKHATGGKIPVSASLGVAMLEGEESLERLVDRADRAMYTSKGGGRNRVISSSRSRRCGCCSCPGTRATSSSITEYWTMVLPVFKSRSSRMFSYARCAQCRPYLSRAFELRGLVNRLVPLKVMGSKREVNGGCCPNAAPGAASRQQQTHAKPAKGHLARGLRWVRRMGTDVYFTKNTEYHVVNAVCVRVMRRADARRLSDHPSVAAQLLGGVRFPAEAPVPERLARPRLGDRLVFDGVDGMVISTSLDRIETRDASGLVTAENGEDVATWRRKRA